MSLVADANSGIFTLPTLSWHDFLLFTEACKFGLDFAGAGELIQLVHFHPSYDRNDVNPTDSLHYGHLPPTSWLNPMASHIGQPPVDPALEAYQDYQRRSPLPMVNVLRGEQLAKATIGSRVQQLDVGDGRTVQASGLGTYVRNGRVLAEEGERLRVELEREVAEGMAALGAGWRGGVVKVGEEGDETKELVRHWSDEYQRYYVYDEVKGESTWL